VIELPRVPGLPDYDPPALPPGRYELLVTEQVARATAALGHRASLRPLTRDETPSYLSRHFRQLLSKILRSIPLEDHTQRQVELCNLLIHEIDRFIKNDAERSSDSIARADVLLSVLADQPIGLGEQSALEAPLTPLSDDAFFTNSPNDPRLAGELRREIRSADRIDLLCAFITRNGLRIFKDDLRRAFQRGASLRVITTTYTGITEPKALDELIGLGASIKVSYDTRATRLHAKAWLFVRNSGFGTAYLGSSNVTHAALHEGLEWNVRLSQASSPDLIDRFGVTFDSYWDDDRFEAYDDERFAAAVTRERGRQPGADVDLASLAEFEIRPFPYQAQILEQLAVERDRHGHRSNLVVAATGTERRSSPHLTINVSGKPLGA
jgi:HKD family nuclease